MFECNIVKLFEQSLVTKVINAVNLNIYQCLSGSLPSITPLEAEPRGLTDLGETVGAGLEDDQQHPDGDGDLLQLQVVGHARPPQHPPHAVPRRDRDLPQPDGQAVELGGGQAQAVQQLQREAACGRRGGGTAQSCAAHGSPVAPPGRAHH